MLTKLSLAVAALIISLGVFLFPEKEKKTGYVQIQKVFNEFIYKKEMEARLKKVKEVRNRELDSLEMQLKILFKEIELDRKNLEKQALFQAKKEEFIKKRDAYTEDYEKSVAQYNEVIIKQMNQYIKEFGEDKSYGYIFGTDGKGNLMYADSVNDLTKDIISYINQKYAGTVKK